MLLALRSTSCSAPDGPSQKRAHARACASMQSMAHAHAICRLPARDHPTFFCFCFVCLLFFMGVNTHNAQRDDLEGDELESRCNFWQR